MTRISTLIAGIAVIILTITSESILFAQNAAASLRAGNKAYDKGDFKEAEINYRKGL